jgi:hypothetical protein
MLDTLPGVRMSGENNGALNAIQRMQEHVIDHEQFQAASGRKTPWGHNPIVDGSMGCFAQSMIEAINPPLVDDQGKVLHDDWDTIIGFKTVRFLNDVTEEGDLERISKWLQGMFPCGRFIVNIRSDVYGQVASWKHAFCTDEADVRDKLSRRNDLITKLARELGEQAYFLDSTQWTADMSPLNKAVEWLGFSQACFFHSLLEMNTQDGGYGDGRKWLNQDPECLYKRFGSKP